MCIPRRTPLLTLPSLPSPTTSVFHSTALLSELQTGDIRDEVKSKWDDGKYGSKVTLFYDDADALGDTRVEYMGHTVMFAFFGMVFQGLAAIKAAYFLFKDHCCDPGPTRGGASSAEEET